MDLLAAVLSAGLVFQGGTEIAVGGGVRGPWQQNDSRYDYVDDPAVAIDREGRVAVAWVDQARKDVFLRTSSGRTVNASRSPETFSWLPKLTIDPRSPRVFHLLWQEIIFSGGSHGGDILYARSSDGGRSFSTPRNLSQSMAGDGKGRTSPEHWHNGSLDIAVGTEGAVYAAWTEYEGRLLVAVSQDGGGRFSAPRHVAGSDSRPTRAPALSVGPEGTVYLAWTDGEVRIAASVDGGGSFGAPLRATRSAAYSDAPKVAVDPRKVLHLAWSENGHVHYSRSGDGGRSFQPPRALGTGAFPSLELDGDAGVYLVWERRRGLAASLSRDGGETFSPARTIPGSAERPNGGLQGKLLDRLAVNAAGEVAVANSSFRPGQDSRIWLAKLSRAATPSRD